MTTFKPGDRVAAVQYRDLEKLSIELAGYGIYLGRQLPETDDVFIFGFSAKKTKIPVVCVLLDNGLKVYATEFIFFNEETIKNNIHQFKSIVYLDQNMIKQNRTLKSYK